MDSPARTTVSDQLKELLTKLYNDPKTGFVGAQSLYDKAKRIDSSIRIKDVKSWYASNADAQQFQDQRKRFDHFHIASNNPDSWQMDLAFWDGVVLLTAVNINSRIGYADLIPNKQADTVLKALKRFVKQHKPKITRGRGEASPVADASPQSERQLIITSDNGSEFMNQQVQIYFKKSKITHFNNEAGEHSTMGKIERFNRTLKQRLLRSGMKLTKRLISDLVANYNSTKHSAIGMTPNEAKGTVIQSELNHNQELLRKVDNEFTTGETVVYRLKHKQFAKESAKWSTLVYEIAGLDGYRIQIRSKNGHILYKSPNELKRVKLGITDTDVEPGQIFEAEAILKHKTMRSGKNKYLVKWKGYDEPSWESQDNLRLINKNVMSTLEKQYFKY